MFKYWLKINGLGYLFVSVILAMIGLVAYFSFVAMVATDYTTYRLDGESVGVQVMPYGGYSVYLLGDGGMYYYRSFDEPALVYVVNEEGKEEFWAVSDVPEERLPGMSQSFLGKFVTEKGKEYRFSNEVSLFVDEEVNKEVVIGDETFSIFLFFVFIFFLIIFLVLFWASVTALPDNISKTRDVYLMEMKKKKLKKKKEVSIEKTTS